MNGKKNLILVVTLVFTLVFLFGSFTSTGEAAPKKIGITKFDGTSVASSWNNEYDIGAGAADMLTNELVKNKNYMVFERQQLSEVLSEQRLGASGVVDDATAARIGKVVGLDYIVYGKIVSAGAEKTGGGAAVGPWAVANEHLTVKVVVAVRMIDATTGAVVMSHTATGEVKKSAGGLAGTVGGRGFATGSKTKVTFEVYDQAAILAIKEIAGKINALNPLEGTIVEVDRKTIYLDLGSEQGVEAGNRFQIYREGKPIINARGQVIGMTRIDIATVKVVSVDSLMSICKVEGSGKIMPGDKARLL